MKLYTSVKVVKAVASGDYGRAGYTVEFSNGEQVWRTKQQFEDNYRPCAGMPFSVALEAMKRGKSVHRQVWPSSKTTAIYKDTYGSFIGPEDIEEEDILAEDWEILV